MAVPFLKEQWGAQAWAILALVWDWRLSPPGRTRRASETDSPLGRASRTNWGCLLGGKLLDDRERLVALGMEGSGSVAMGNPRWNTFAGSCHSNRAGMERLTDPRILRS